MSNVTLLPRISEKAIAMAEKGVYVFDVPSNANKIEVARTVAANFNVQVMAVNMLITKGKPVSKRVSRGISVNRSDSKKAMVTIKKGQKIDLFEGAK